MTIAADFKAVTLVDAATGDSTVVAGTIIANAGIGNFNVVGTKSSNGGVPGSTNLGILPAVANAVAPTFTEGNQTGLSVDLSGALRTSSTNAGLTDAQLRAFAATLGVTATAAVGVGATLTLPAAGAGLFQYISNLEITADTAPVALAANASAVITSTNLSGSPAWNVKVERNGGGVNTVRRMSVIPLRTAVANTATTIVAPAVANTIWRLNVEYYTGP